MTSALQVVVDTNTFIHVRDVKDLPWHDLFAEAEGIELIVTSVVFDELDVMKVGTNRRLRDRSRAALKLIDAASQQPGQRLILREGRPEIAIQLDHTLVDWNAFPRLDRTRNDDQLVATALTRAVDAPCVVLSLDTGPRARARLHGLAAYEPPEDWLLPAQEDEHSKEIRRLRAEVDALTKAYPEIDADVLDAKGEAVERVVARVPILPYLPERVVGRMLAAFLDAHPRKEVRGVFTGMPGYDREPAYYSEYQEFCAKVRKAFEDLPAAMAEAGRGVTIRYRLTNSSTHTAHKLRLAFSTRNDSVLLTERDERRSRGMGAMRLPRVPEPPRPLDLTAGLVRRTIRPRDPVGFYWQDRPGPSDRRGSLICEEFRPSDTYRLDFVTYPLSGNPYEGEVTLDVSATNLPQPIHRSIPVELREAPAEWSDADVLLLLPKEVRSVLAAAIAAGELKEPGDPPAKRSLEERLGLNRTDG